VIKPFFLRWLPFSSIRLLQFVPPLCAHDFSMLSSTLCTVVRSPFMTASLTFLGTLLLETMRIITLQEALEGFSNSAVASILLRHCVLLQQLLKTSLLDFVVGRVLGQPQSTFAALLRFLPFVVLLSAFINNTSIVLIFMKVLLSWSIRVGMPLSRLLMPLSFASILGAAGRAQLLALQQIWLCKV
jgi:hypothetical protein